jgi:hypothetical protein
MQGKELDTEVIATEEEILRPIQAASCLICEGKGRQIVKYLHINNPCNTV